MGAGKAAFNLFKVLAIVVSLTATVCTGLVVYDAAKISQPSISDVKYSAAVGPPPQFNVSFVLTVGYGGSVFTFQNINLTVAVYPDSDGVGDPLFSNTTMINLAPGSPPVTINYVFTKTNPPLFTHLSVKAFAKGVIAWGSLTFMGFGLDMLYTLY